MKTFIYYMLIMVFLFSVGFIVCNFITCNKLDGNYVYPGKCMKNLETIY